LSEQIPATGALIDREPRGVQDRFMKKQPIHQNLNTSFVNVSDLVEFLRGLQFVGCIRIEFASYEADITFSRWNTIEARECDHIAGLISHGEAALKRILIRSREPHGLVHVFKMVEGYAGHDFDGSIFIDKAIMRRARDMAASPGGTTSEDMGYTLSLSGRAGRNARVLGALSELLREIDDSLTARRLSFAAAFRLACKAITSDYPFLQRNSHALEYRDGEIRLNVDADAKLVASAVFAALRPIFRRLRNEEKHRPLINALSERLQTLSAARRAEFVSLGLIRHINELLAD